MRRVTVENPVNQGTVTSLKTSQETGGAFALLEVVLGPGGENALHFHTAFSERFAALDTPLQLATATEAVTLAPG